MLATLLLLVAFVVAAFGVLSLSQATAGVGVLCLACFLAIVARLAQAAHQHTELKAVLERGRSAAEPAVIPRPVPAAPTPAPEITNLDAAAQFYGVKTSR